MHASKDEGLRRLKRILLEKWYPERVSELDQVPVSSLQVYVWEHACVFCRIVLRSKEVEDTPDDNAEGDEDFELGSVPGEDSPDPEDEPNEGEEAEEVGTGRYPQLHCLLACLMVAWSLALL